MCLQFLVGVVYEQLVERVALEAFEAKHVKESDRGDTLTTSHALGGRWAGVVVGFGAGIGVDVGVVTVETVEQAVMTVSILVGVVTIMYDSVVGRLSESTRHQQSVPPRSDCRLIYNCRRCCGAL